MQAFVDFLVTVADSFYQFLEAFSAQISQALGGNFPVTPITLFWVFFILNVIVIPLIFILPNFSGKDSSKKK